MPSTGGQRGHTRTNCVDPDDSSAVSGRELQKRWWPGHQMARPHIFQLSDVFSCRSGSDTSARQGRGSDVGGGVVADGRRGHGASLVGADDDLLGQVILLVLGGLLLVGGAVAGLALGCVEGSLTALDDGLRLEDCLLVSGYLVLGSLEGSGSVMELSLGLRDL